MILSSIFLKERLKPIKYVFLLLAIIGIVILGVAVIIGQLLIMTHLIIVILLIIE